MSKAGLLTQWLIISKKSLYLSKNKHCFKNGICLVENFTSGHYLRSSISSEISERTLKKLKKTLSTFRSVWSSYTFFNISISLHMMLAFVSRFIKKTKSDLNI